MVCNLDKDTDTIKRKIKSVDEQNKELDIQGCWQFVKL